VSASPVAGPPVNGAPGNEAPVNGAPGGESTMAMAERFGLRHLGGRPPLTGYLAELWQRRFFTVELARSRFRAENEADRLGVAWIVLRPLINAAVYGLVFGVILFSDSKPKDYLPFLVSGVFIFQYFAGSLADGARAIVANMGLVTSLHFPRAVLPISIVLQQLFGIIWMVLTLCVIVVANGDPVRVSWVMVVPVLALMTLFNLGVAFIAARMTIHLRDIAQLIPFVTRMFFYLSGIFVSIPKLVGVHHATWLQVLEANPLYVFITLVRVALLGPSEDVVGRHYDPARVWLYAVVWGFGLLTLGFLFFWRAEDEYGRE
jgi:teichoic acid transport system permease protein